MSGDDVGVGLHLLPSTKQRWWCNCSCRVRGLARVSSIAAIVVIAMSGLPESHGQALKENSRACRDPLYEMHWAGKNDIQTLRSFPTVRTNLKLCPAFNQKASCCHQTFESEQQKYYGFWQLMLGEKLLRLDAHRQAVQAAGSDSKAKPTSRVDREQYEAVLALYADVLSSDAQNKCFSVLLTYVAGMICFSCEVEWFHYAILSGGGAKGLEKVIALRMARSVCLELWAACRGFGASAAALHAAIRDSSVARAVDRAPEDMRMFMGQQQLCDWMHDKVALHPFQLPTKEDRDVARWSEGGSPQRRLAGPNKALDVLGQGRLTGFDLRWHSPTASSSGAGEVCRLLSPATVAMVVALLLVAQLRP